MVIIRNMSINDIEQKGYVHFKAWQETYKGLMDDRYLDNHTLEKCVQIAEKFPENTLVAVFDQKVVGFAAYTVTDYNDEKFGEIKAIYILKEYQNRGVGKALMRECLKRLIHNENIIVWVLKNNKKSIDWYSNFGFQIDGLCKEIKVLEDYCLNEIRLTYQNISYTKSI